MDVKPYIFQEVLRFIYTGEIRTFCEDEWLNILHAAAKYELENLKQICINHLMKKITIKNAADIVTMSHIIVIILCFSARWQTGENFKFRVIVS